MTNPSCALSLTPEGQFLLHTKLRDGTDFTHKLPKGKVEQGMLEILSAQRLSPAVGTKSGSTAITLGQILAHIAAVGTTTPAQLERRKLETARSAEDLGL